MRGAQARAVLLAVILGLAAGLGSLEWRIGAGVFFGALAFCLVMAWFWEMLDGA